jgi:hypothetical protein
MMTDCCETCRHWHHKVTWTHHISEVWQGQRVGTWSNKCLNRNSLYYATTTDARFVCSHFERRHVHDKPDQS